MKRTHVIAVLVGMAAIATLSSPAHARLYMMMQGSNVYPGVATPMPPGPMQPMMAAPMAGGFGRPHVGVNVYPAVSTPMPHPDGPNLYQYVRSNPVRYRDPSGLSAYDDYNKLSPAERSVVFWNPIDACYSKRCVGDAFKAAQNSGLDGAHNGPQDAFRHCVWTCCMAQKSNADFSKKMSNAHESTSTSKDETSMDLHNNGVGIDIGKGGGDCAAGCKDALKNGKLRVLRQAGSGPVPGGTPLQPSQ
jgi:hypothetical protein